MAGRNPTVFIDTGAQFGRLTFVEETKNKGRRAAVCKCICGNTKVINISALTSGAVSSCGCLRKELAQTRATERNSSPNGGTSAYVINDEGRECAGNYCGNVYKLWSEFNKGNAAHGRNSWCRECTKAHYLAKQLTV